MSPPSVGFIRCLISAGNVFFQFLSVAASVNVSLCSDGGMRARFDGCWEKVSALCLSSAYLTQRLPSGHLVTANSLVLWQPNPRGVEQIWSRTFTLLPQLCVMTLMKSKHTWSITFAQWQCLSCIFPASFMWLFFKFIYAYVGLGRSLIPTASCWCSRLPAVAFEDLVGDWIHSDANSGDALRGSTGNHQYVGFEWKTWGFSVSLRLIQDQSDAKHIPDLINKSSGEESLARMCVFLRHLQQQGCWRDCDGCQECSFIRREGTIIFF